ncbi:MAG: hypothetical protein ACKV2U_33140 [Bryobacteraceae bacterium]
MDTRLDIALKLTRIAMHTAVIFGIVFALALARDWKLTLDNQLRSDRIVQSRHISDFAVTHLQKSQEVAAFVATLPERCKLSRQPCLPYPDELFRQNGEIGERMYRSAELAKFRDIGDTYEVLGTLVRQGYLDFDFVYTVIFFPDDFWDSTSAYRNKIQSNWKKRDAPIDDFWGNFSWLRDEYLKARRRAAN